jgi:hypothetical protein
MTSPRMGRIGRRPVFFGLIAVLCLVLVPWTPTDLRWVPWSQAALAVVWMALLALDDLFAPVRPRRRAADHLVRTGAISKGSKPIEPRSPFDPPPGP